MSDKFWNQQGLFKRTHPVFFLPSLTFFWSATGPGAIFAPRMRTQLLSLCSRSDSISCSHHRWGNGATSPPCPTVCCPCPVDAHLARAGKIPRWLSCLNKRTWQSSRDTRHVINDPLARALLTQSANPLLWLKADLISEAGDQRQQRGYGLGLYYRPWSYDRRPLATHKAAPSQAPSTTCSFISNSNIFIIYLVLHFPSRKGIEKCRLL